VSGLTVNLSGFSALHTRLEKLSNDQQTKIGQAANRAGAVIIAKKAKASAPVSTQAEGSTRTRHTKGGTTRQEVHKKIVNSIKVKKAKSDATTKVKNRIVVGTYTAHYVEFGSIHNAPNPFLRTAFEQGEQDAINQIAKVLDKRLVKAGV
jgi:HK97 gp10 family phage protein